MNIKFLYNRWLKRNLKFIVYGDSGVGKTQFLYTVTGKNAYLPTRTRKVEHYSLILSSGRKIEFLDTPGHQTSRTFRNDVLNKMQQGKIDGLINLVNFGYQDSEHLDHTKAFNNDTNEVKESYLSDNRRAEIKRTKEFIDVIGPKAKLKWVITIINKADVWKHRDTEVIEYYQNGEYNTEVSSLCHATEMSVFPFCSVITPFGNRPMMLTFGEKDKKEMYDNVITHISSLAEE